MIIREPVMRHAAAVRNPTTTSRRWPRERAPPRPSAAGVGPARQLHTRRSGSCTRRTPRRRAEGGSRAHRRRSGRSSRRCSRSTPHPRSCRAGNPERSTRLRTTTRAAKTAMAPTQRRPCDRSAAGSAFTHAQRRRNRRTAGVPSRGRGTAPPGGTGLRPRIAAPGAPPPRPARRAARAVTTRSRPRSRSAW